MVAFFGSTLIFLALPVTARMWVQRCALSVPWWRWSTSYWRSSHTSEATPFPGFTISPEGQLQHTPTPNHSQPFPTPKQQNEDVICAHE